MEFETFIHFDVPADYRLFLKSINGCVPSIENNTYHSKRELPGGSSITIDRFYTLSYKDPELPSLFRELEENVDLMGETSIPIGIDNFGNLIGLDCNANKVNWTLLEPRFTLDHLMTFSLQVEFGDFLNSLTAGPGA